MTTPIVRLDPMTDDEVKHAHREGETGFGALETAKGRLPLAAMDVRAEISGLVAQVDLRQVFINSIGEPLEATYIFPLPDRAAVTSFRLEVAGRVVDGVIEERGKAREQYDRAIAAGHRAAITEEDRAGVFTIRVGNIMPGERAAVHLVLTGPLTWDEGEVTFQFPLVVAPRYIPGSALGGGDVGDGTAHDTDAVPDASRITPPVLLPGFPNPVRLSLSATVESGGALLISDLRSSLHAVVEQGDGHKRRIEIHPGERLNRDFILRFRLGEEAVRSSLVFTPDAGGIAGEGGTFALTLLPPASAAKAIKPRDVVFVLDRSGSMEGWKITAARRAVARMIDTLGERDCFSVIAFDHAIEVPRGFDDLLLYATDRNRFKAVQFLSTLESRGGTEMFQPLATAADLLAGGYADRDRILVLATDGQVGNEDQILRDLSPKLRGTRIFTLGIDRAVNQAFITRLASLGGGLSELVESEDRLDDVMAKIHRRIGTPVLTEISVLADGLDADMSSLVPDRRPALFAGAPLVMFGRYRGSPQGGLRIKGTDANGAPWEEKIAGRRSTSDKAITSLWARAMVRQLEDRYATRGDDDLHRRIVEISTRFSVLSRFTAFIAVDRAEVVNKGGGGRKLLQAVEMPEGWNMGTVQHAMSLGRARMGAAPGGPSGGAPPPAPMQAVASVRAASIDYDKLMAEFADEDEDVVAAAEAPAPPPPPQGYKPAPIPAPKAAKLRGHFSAPREQKREEAQGEGGPPELRAYVDRIREILDALQKAIDEGDTSALAAALRRVWVDLKRLVEDLESVGAAPSFVSPLSDLVARLAGVAATADRAKLDELSREAVLVLNPYVKTGGTPSAPSRRKSSFWK